MRIAVALIDDGLARIETAVEELRSAEYEGPDHGEYLRGRNSP